MPTMKPIAGSDKERPLKTEWDEWRYTPTPRRSPRAVPTIGIFEEPTRCVQINKEWWSHISGMIDVLSSPELWAGDDDEKTRAIREIAALLASEACMSIDYDALTQAIRDGIYTAGNDFAKQLISGGTTNIVVDDEGNVTVPSDAITIPPVEDDPDTALDESLASAAGGAIGIRLGFNDIWGSLITWYAGAISAAETTSRLLKIYKWVSDAECSAFVNDYYAARAGALAFITTWATSLDSKMYCKGHTKQQIFDWIYDTYVTSQQDMSLDLCTAIADEQIALWYAYGQQTPSTAYLEYSCTKIQFEEFTFNMALANAPAYTTNGVWKGGHRFLVEISGSYADSDLPDLLGDGMYFLVPSTGVKTYSPLSFNFGGAVTAPVQAQVPYSAAHVYSFTVEKLVGSGSAAGIITRDNGSMTIPNVTGILTVKITDLGEFAV